ncbi:hypothetical protein EDEG_02170 [Edhazardia aedis USNM 41457]|uniref:Uncharacterized protein n=1 Tax=Edhazardia aedis (strain USNM 41457) TaxID=1003232 RepID=J9D6U2_EDHAE|nr:hypothetical protein EDEG_02170 [Edhazardia aedis USNM 41457]|eukprot:EJW03496.1 hypothetical protein EDEG_02170 [Edhazardia aedis USNM 41457]
MIFFYILNTICWDENLKYYIRNMGTGFYMSGSQQGYSRPRGISDDPTLADLYNIKNADDMGTEKYLSLSASDNKTVLTVPFLLSTTVFYDDFRESTKQKFRLDVLEDNDKFYHIMYGNNCLEYNVKKDLYETQKCSTTNLFQIFRIFDESMMGIYGSFDMYGLRAMSLSQWGMNTFKYSISNGVGMGNFALNTPSSIYSALYSSGGASGLVGNADSYSRAYSAILGGAGGSRSASIAQSILKGGLLQNSADAANFINGLNLKQRSLLKSKLCNSFGLF